MKNCNIYYKYHEKVVSLVEEICDRCPGHHIKIEPGDFNDKMGRENVFLPIIGKFSIHTNISDNGMRLIGFAASKNMAVNGTRFQHKDIHTATWVPLDQRTKNPIDHVVIGGRKPSNIKQTSKTDAEKAEHRKAAITRGSHNLLK